MSDVPEQWPCRAVRAGRCKLADEDGEPLNFRVVLEFSEIPALRFSDVWFAKPLLLSRDPDFAEVPIGEKVRP
jgi:hypothetical protein